MATISIYGYIWAVKTIQPFAWQPNGSTFEEAADIFVVILAGCYTSYGAISYNEAREQQLAKLNDENWTKTMKPQ